MSISTLQRSEKSITVDFPIGEVKNAVKKIADELSTKYGMVTGGANEVFNTYQFYLNNGMIIGIGDLILEDAGNGRTKISLVVNNAHGSQGTSPILEGMSNDYLSVLGKVLTGQDIEKEKAAAKKSGWGGFVFLIAFVIIIVIIVRALMN